jgi:hypothetical protein
MRSQITAGYYVLFSSAVCCKRDKNLSHIIFNHTKLEIVGHILIVKREEGCARFAALQL